MLVKQLTVVGAITLAWSTKIAVRTSSSAAVNEQTSFEFHLLAFYLLHSILQEWHRRAQMAGIGGATAWHAR